jgi:hypothetical protein
MKSWHSQGHDAAPLVPHLFSIIEALGHANCSAFQLPESTNVQPLPEGACSCTTTILEVVCSDVKDRDVVVVVGVVVVAVVVVVVVV